MFYYFILFYFIYCYFIAMSILYRLYRLQRLLQHAYNTKIFELSASRTSRTIHHVRTVTASPEILVLLPSLCVGSSVEIVIGKLTYGMKTLRFVTDITALHHVLICQSPLIRFPYSHNQKQNLSFIYEM